MTQLSQEQNDIRFANRRKIAVRSFYFMSMSIFLLLGFGLVSNDMAARVSSLQWLLTVSSGLWGTLILGYMAAASYEQTRPPERPAYSPEGPDG